jgi:hypothetical protein
VGEETTGTPGQLRLDEELLATVDVALTLADDAAHRRDYGHALEYLEAADDLTDGALGPSIAGKRAMWRNAFADRGMPSPDVLEHVRALDELPLA